MTFDLLTVQVLGICTSWTH